MSNHTMGWKVHCKEGKKKERKVGEREEGREGRTKESCLGHILHTE